MAARPGHDDDDKQLHDAAYAGDLDKLRTLLQEDHFSRRINEWRSWWGIKCTPLVLAARWGHAACVDYLITHGAQVDISDDEERRPLYWAVLNGHLDCVRILLEAGADPNRSGIGSYTPIYWAAQKGRLDMLQELIRFGAVPVDMDSDDILWRSPLYISVFFRHLDCFRLLLQVAGVLTRVMGSRLLHMVLRHGCDAAFVQLLLDHGANLVLLTWEQAQLGERVDPEALRVFLEAKRCPSSLAHACRIRIRQALGTHRLNKVHSLPLTQVMKDFVRHQN